MRQDNFIKVLGWVKDGVTTKITFMPGTYEFTQPLVISNDSLVLKGSGEDQTILKLTSRKKTLIDAVGDHIHVEDITLDGGDNQKSYGNPIFLFDKSKGHSFYKVTFQNSLQGAIGASAGYATDGLILESCIFRNIDNLVVQIFNRNTIKRGKLILKVDKVVIDGCLFEAGYETAISSDNGNDREDSGDGTGRRYTESTSLSGTVIRNCTFGKSKQFHIALVQTEDVIIKNNVFKGMTDDAGRGCQPIHMEQFTHNIEIYNNQFMMANTVSDPCIYIRMSGTEGHKRVTQQRPSNTYPQWTYKVYGGNERRASVARASSGNVNKDCKRDVHAYGPRNIFIAGNTFAASENISQYISIVEGENIKIGMKKNGQVALNKFLGGNENSIKIWLGGHDEGTGAVLIKAGQNVVPSNVKIMDVSFDLPPVRIKKPIVIETGATSSSSGWRTTATQPLVSPNPAQDVVRLNVTAKNYILE